MPDTRGYGESDKPPGPVSRQTLAADMVGVLDHFDIDEVALVGHDWGGIIGFKVVIDWPERISSVALMDTLCTVWTPFAIHGFWFKARPLPEHFYAEYHEQFIETIFTGESDPRLPEWPAAPWSVGRRLSPNRWATDEDVEVYKRGLLRPRLAGRCDLLLPPRAALPSDARRRERARRLPLRAADLGPGRRSLASRVERPSLGHGVHGVRT